MQASYAGSGLSSRSRSYAASGAVLCSIGSYARGAGPMYSELGRIRPVVAVLLDHVRGPSRPPGSLRRWA